MATMRVTNIRGTANFVITRDDGHQLSMAEDNEVIHFSGLVPAEDHGRVFNVQKFLAIALQFVAMEEE
jgi:hypothetical protein